jgi:hypothetical protein
MEGGLRMKIARCIAVCCSAVLFVVSCVSAPVSDIKVANIDRLGAYLELSRWQYTVLSLINGSGTVTVDKNGKLLSGDTHNYGYLGLMSEGVLPKDITAIARANAVYQMIEAARAVEADAVIFVNTMIAKTVREDGNFDITVSVQGTAIKLKTEGELATQYGIEE